MCQRGPLVPVVAAHCHLWRLLAFAIACAWLLLLLLTLRLRTCLSPAKEKTWEVSGGARTEVVGPKEMQVVSLVLVVDVDGIFCIVYSHGGVLELCASR